jgi:hypothetical protein
MKPSKSFMRDVQFQLRFLECMLASFEGCTIHVESGLVSRRSEGYWASFECAEFNAHATDSYSIAYAFTMLRKRAKVRKSAYIGIWKDHSTLVFDLSKWFASKDECLAFARANQQRAIWDCANSVPISVEG